MFIRYVEPAYNWEKQGHVYVDIYMYIFIYNTEKCNSNFECQECIAPPSQIVLVNPDDFL